MDRINLRTLDLNLFKVLEKLLEYKHVSKAAVALNMSQPAVSRALSRLREHFNDPLLVKTSNGYKLTNKAIYLQDQLKNVFTSIKTMLQLDEFDPSTIKGKFTIAARDFEMLVFIPKLIEFIRERVPGLNLQVVPFCSQIGLHTTLNNYADLVLHSTNASFNGIYKQKLFSDTYSVILSKNHPLANKELTLDDYCLYKHAVISSKGISARRIDCYLKKLNKKRDVVLSIPYFSMAPTIVSNSNLIMTIPSRIISLLGVMDDIVVKELPFHVENILIEQFWHELYHSDVTHRWMRQQVSNIICDS